MKSIQRVKKYPEEGKALRGRKRYSEGVISVQRGVISVQRGKKCPKREKRLEEG